MRNILNKRLVTTVFLLFICFLNSPLFAQEYVVDAQVCTSVITNGTVRSVAENTHQQYLGKINDNLNDINNDVGSVVLAQTIIYNALSDVNSALKDGLAVKNMTITIADMTGYLNQAVTLAKGEPYLLLFASNIGEEMRQRSVALVTDVSSYILKQGNNILADYNARDELLHKVTQQLQILDALAYGAWKAMFWAKERGIIASLDPFAAYINRDKQFVLQIITNAKYLKQ